jgi:pimeloyl-ACP methyl ester carboxylesterase
MLPGAFEQAVTNAATSFETVLPAVREWRFDEAQARRIAQPCLLVLGEESIALNARFLETHRQLLAWLPDVEGVVVPGATHFVHVEKPAATADALGRFLARHALDEPP